MAFAGRKKDKLKILEDIYHDNSQVKSDKTKIKEFFQDKNRTETLLSFAIIIVGLGAITLGLFQLQDNVAFRKTPVKKVASNLDKDDLLGQKNKDTDQDGLSDYDELYVYKSSPYLEDSDSDGIDDKSEIAHGKNPTCPEGQNCFGSWSDLTNPNAATTTDEYELPTGMDLTKLRQALVDAGMSQEQVDQLSDDSILAAYQEYLSAAGISQTDISSITTSGNTASFADQINSLNADQIRELLVSEGDISKTELDKISDADLLKMVQETLGSSSQTSSSNKSTAATSNLSADQIKNLTPAQIRQLLIEEGSIPASTINQISDEALLQMVKETLVSQ